MFRNNLWDFVVRSPDEGGSSAPTESVSSGPAVGSSAAGNMQAVEPPAQSEADFDFSLSDSEMFGTESPVQAGPEGSKAAPGAPQVPADGTPVAKPAVPEQTAKEPPAANTSPAAPDPNAPKPQAPAPATPPQGEAPKSGAPSETLLKQIEAGRESFMKALTDEHFKLSQEDITAIESGEAATVIPKLMAKTMFETVRSTVSILETQLPQLVAAAVEANARNGQSKSDFYSSFPELKEHEPQVTVLAQTLRKMNPSMPREEFIKKLGETSRTVLGIVPTQQPSVSAPAAKGNGSSFRPTVSSVPQNVQRAPIDPNSWEAQDAMWGSEG